MDRNLLLDLTCKDCHDGIISLERELLRRPPSHELSCAKVSPTRWMKGVSIWPGHRSYPITQDATSQTPYLTKKAPAYHLLRTTSRVLSHAADKRASLADFPLPDSLGNTHLLSWKYQSPPACFVAIRRRPSPGTVFAWDDCGMALSLETQTSPNMNRPRQPRFLRHKQLIRSFLPEQAHCITVIMFSSRFSARWRLDLRLAHSPFYQKRHSDLTHHLCQLWPNYPCQLRFYSNMTVAN